MAHSCDADRGGLGEGRVKSLKLVIAAHRYDYGDPARGASSDHYNLVLPLQKLFPTSIHYDFRTRLKELGRRRMNAEFVNLVRTEAPDVTIVALAGSDFEPEAIDRARAWTTTVAYFWDDVWRRKFASFWASHFDFVTTSDPGGVARFERRGHRNAIYSPFCFNSDVFHPDAGPYEHEVSFVGQYHPYRAWVIDRMRRAGIAVETFGHRWQTGRIERDAMVRMFSRSRINLNLSNSSHWDLALLVSYPATVAWNVKLGKHAEQVKSRHFEIAGSGGFQLSYAVDHLAEYFRPGREIVTFKNISELIAKTKYFLANDDERGSIAELGRERAHAEHTAERRYADLITEIRARLA